MKNNIYRAFFASVALYLSTGASAQNPQTDYMAILKAAGFTNINVVSFAETKKKHALTFLYRSDTDKDPLTIFAEISPTKEGADLAFRVYRPCVQSNGKLQNQIIVISGQKIETSYGCAMSPHETKTQEIYIIKSLAGNDFAKKEFTESKYVVVDIFGLDLLISTEGFPQALAASSGKAL